MTSPHLLASDLRKLKLPTMLPHWEELSQQCTDIDLSYGKFLERLVEREVIAREKKVIDRRLRQAGFPVPKDLLGLEFAAVPTRNRKSVLDLARGNNLEKRENLVLVGPRGVGKSHLATACGREACRGGFRVKLFTAAGLVNTHLATQDQSQFLRVEARIGRSDLETLDELGNIPLDKIGAEHLFRFLSRFYEPPA